MENDAKEIMSKFRQWYREKEMEHRINNIMIRDIKSSISYLLRWAFIDGFNSNSIKKDTK